MEPSVANEVSLSEANKTLIFHDDVNMSCTSLVQKFDLEADENNRVDRDKNEASQLNKSEPNMFNLFVDLNSCKVPYVDLKYASGISDQGIVSKRESFRNNVEFNVGDVVWGKVRSHPWWPGQIFDPSASSNKAMKYFKKDRLLIAYFGDQSFAFNEPSHIKPFRTNFARMVTQSNMDSFCHAVDCALVEISRRIECGLACSCLPKEVYSKIRLQIVDNSGICKKSSRRDGGDRFSGVDSFEPGKVVSYLKLLAENPFRETDELEIMTVRAQIQAFNRYKKLNPLQLINGLVINDEKCPSEVIEDSNNNVHEKKRKRNSVDDDDYVTEKEKLVSELMPESCSEKNEMSSNSSERKRKAFALGINGSRVKKFISPPRKLTKLGERIRKVVSQLSRLPPVKRSLKFKNDADSIGVVAEQYNKEKVTPAEYPPVNEILSVLYMAAVDPVNCQHSSLISMFSFFSNYRKKFSGETNSKTKTCDEAIVEPGFVETEDSYRTDRIVQGNPNEQQVLFEPVVVDSSDPNQENSVIKLENETEKKVKEECSPTALIFNFSNLNSVPSESNLNEIFCRYGPLNEAETEVIRKGKNRVKLVFKKRCDAETAFSSAGKFSIFGPSLISYQLNYSPTPRKKNSTPGKRKIRDINGISNASPNGV